MTDGVERIERPVGAPGEGVIPAYDAGWNAAEVGLSRRTVEVLTPPSGLGWALLAYDTARLVQREATS